MSIADRAPPNPAAQLPDELQELADADLEELEPTLQMAIAHGGPERTSTPPPLPIEARRSSVPPAPPQSGMFRISERPAPAADPSALAEQIRSLQAELHERTTQVDRMRLALTLRDDRLHALQRSLDAQRERADELERSLAVERERVSATEHALRARETVMADDLRRIAGIGPVFARKLAERGVTQFEQLAAFGPEQVAELAELLGIPVRRIESGGWVAKAAELAAAKARPVSAG